MTSYAIMSPMKSYICCVFACHAICSALLSDNDYETSSVMDWVGNGSDSTSLCTTSFLAEDLNGLVVGVGVPGTAHTKVEMYIDTAKTDISRSRGRCPDPRTSSGSLYYLHHTRKRASSNKASIGSEQTSMPSLYSPCSLLVVALLVFVAVAILLNFAPMLSYFLGYLIETVPFWICYTTSGIYIWISTLSLLLSYFLAYLFLLLLMLLPFPRESTACILIKNSVTRTFDILLEQIHEYRRISCVIVLFTVIVSLLVKCFTIRQCSKTASMANFIERKVVKLKETTSESNTVCERCDDDQASEKCRTGQPMNLVIHIGSNFRPLPISVEPNMPISELKERILDLTGYSACRSRLVFGGTELSPPKRICDYEICEGSRLDVSYVGVGGTTLITEEMKQKFASIPTEARYFYWSRDELVAMSAITKMDTEEVKLETMRGNDEGFKVLNLRKLNPSFPNTVRYYMPVASASDVDNARSLRDKKMRTTGFLFRRNRVSSRLSMLYVTLMLIRCYFSWKNNRPESLVSLVEQHLNPRASSSSFNSATPNQAQDGDQAAEDDDASPSITTQGFRCVKKQDMCQKMVTSMCQ